MCLACQELYQQQKRVYNFCQLNFFFFGGGGGLPHITDGDARRNFQKQPLKVTISCVAPANFIVPKRYLGNFHA